MRVGNQKLTESMNAGFSTDAINIERCDKVSVQAVWTESVATLAGTFTIETCNCTYLYNSIDIEDSSATWDEIPGSAVAVSGAGSFTWDIDTLNVETVRVTYTSTTGQGSVDLCILIKESA